MFRRREPERSGTRRLCAGKSFLYRCERRIPGPFSHSAAGHAPFGAAEVLAAFRKFDSIVGCLDVDKVPEAEEIPQELAELAERRAAARKAKNFAESDRLRDEIAAKGYLVEDVPGGGWRLKKK